MKIVIAGAGEVGTHLAKMLSDEEQDIIVIDNDEERLQGLDSYNLMTCEGSAISFSVLKEARVDEADLFIAVTPFETRNAVACSMAKSLGAKRTVARIDNYEFMADEHKDYFSMLGVDDLIYPEYLAAKEIITALNRTWVRNWFELFYGELIVVGVKLRANAKIVGHKLKEISNISNYLHVSAIKRNNETIIPGGEDLILENDIAFIATTKDHVNEVIAVCGKDKIDVDKVLIMGGTPIAIQLATMISDRFNVKIVEKDEDLCNRLAEILPNCKIVQGDIRDADILDSVGISDYDVFISLTESSESNVLGCLMAKDQGVKKTIAEVENIPFINVAESLNIGTVINKKLLASSRIFQIMLDSDVTNAKCLALADAEVAELIVKEGSKVTKADVKDLRLHDDMTIAGLVRNGVGQLVTGDTRLLPGDHVVVFCLSGSIHKIEKVFS
jgi:trk system potassium uptake protein TrkA